MESFDYGSFITVTDKPISEGILLGKTKGSAIVIGNMVVSLDEILRAYKAPLGEISPEKIEGDKGFLEPLEIIDKNIRFSKSIEGKPRVYIPVFPGTNCEYDTGKAFRKAGGETIVLPFLNDSETIIDEAIEAMVKCLERSQILALSGGFSLGDEPDGSGKFIVNVVLNEKVKAAVSDFLRRDGLILGICSGFQALVKSGLFPFGRLGDIGGNGNHSTLFKNKINRHISKMGNTKITSIQSPWLMNVSLGEIHTIPVSHGEGRFIAPEETIKKLKMNHQIVTQYVDFQGRPTMEGVFNPNVSMEAIEGIISPDGKISGKMGHTERYEEGLFKNILGNKEQPLFTSGIDYFK